MLGNVLRNPKICLRFAQERIPVAQDRIECLQSKRTGKA